MRSRIFRVGRVILPVLILMLLLSISGFVVWANTVPQIMPEAELALESNALVRVTETDKWIAFTPTESISQVGYILYPGSRVPAEAYAPLAQAIAQEGYFAAIVYVPLYQAILDTNAADAVMESHQEITTWVVGGHSLGGVAASQFASNHLDEVRGLVLMASQSFPGAGLENSDLQVVSLYGTDDGIFTVEEMAAARPDLPTDTQYIAIEGGNHSQFGWYGAQTGDHPAKISYDDQQAQVVSATLDLLSALSMPQ